MTDNISVAMGESSPVKAGYSFTKSTLTPRAVSDSTR